MRETAAAASPAIWRPYTQHALADVPIPVTRARGATLITEDGAEIFDAISSWWVNLHGHAHPRIARAVAEQAHRLEQVIFAGFTHAPAERLAARLVRIAPRGLDHVFFSDDGSTAVEAALKMAVGFWGNRGEKRPLIAALEHGYHGDTFGAMSVGASGPFTAPYRDMLFEAVQLPFPEPGREERTLRAFERLLKDRGGELAALIVEPLVLGAGGMLMYEPAALRSLRELCDEAGVLLIADEVMTGFGRTGTMFACEQAGISPDILCLSKGITGGFLPLGATLACGRVFAAFHHPDRSKAFFHGHSYSGNPLACAAALASLDLFEDEPVYDRVRAISAIHERELERFRGRPEVAAARRRGTIAALELRVPDAGYLSELGPRLYRFYLSRGALIRPLGNVVYLMPPYCSSEEELLKAYDAIEESLALVAP